MCLCVRSNTFSVSATNQVSNRLDEAVKVTREHFLKPGFLHGVVPIKKPKAYVPSALLIMKKAVQDYLTPMGGEKLLAKSSPTADPLSEEELFQTPGLDDSKNTSNKTAIHRSFTTNATISRENNKSWKSSVLNLFGNWNDDESAAKAREDIQEDKHNRDGIGEKMWHWLTRLTGGSDENPNSPNKTNDTLYSPLPIDNAIDIAIIEDEGYSREALPTQSLLCEEAMSEPSPTPLTRFDDLHRILPSSASAPVLELFDEDDL